MSEIRLGLMTVKGRRHLLCSVVATGPDVWICWPEKMDPQPYRLALTSEEAQELRGALYDAILEARRTKRDNKREFRRGR